MSKGHSLLSHVQGCEAVREETGLVLQGSACFPAGPGSGHLQTGTGAEEPDTVPLRANCRTSARTPGQG